MKKIIIGIIGLLLFCSTQAFANSSTNTKVVDGAASILLAASFCPEQLSAVMQ